MGYGFGAFLLVVGLVLALAVQDGVEAVDLTAVGWIMAAVGLMAIAITAFTLNGRRHTRTQAVTTHRDGTQTVQENQTDI